MHIDMRHVGKEQYQQEVYEKTKNMLMKGSIEASKSQSFHSPDPSDARGKKIVGPAFGKKSVPNKCTACGQILMQSHLQNCEFCEKKICLGCKRICSSCEKTFCHVCSVINYDLRDEREFCLNCND